ncbi:probable G-protein coupled receptor 158 [Leptidea sinapis]|uniref:probable G-protein coupled receptor 158 n=1 Tax=Leptidea sinapis TaxID=189913 RepID=UPI0021C27233|nr:probable G-protein coupled receptor 158 [Leptidea sinapis]
MYEWLGGSPLCDNLTTDCEAVPSQTDDRMLEYQCKCSSDHWHATGGNWISGRKLSEIGQLSCTPCGLGSNSTACLPEVFRAVLLGANLSGMLLCLIIGLIVFKKRKSKAVAMGMWTVLEVVLIGAMFMYGSAASQYISSARWRCVTGAWLRELGFVASYGSVVLRLWVLLAEFRTRKAHRWTPRDAEVLRIVAAMIIGAGCYLAAFTATSACEETVGGGCARTSWHHVTAAAEILLLMAGLRISYAARNANVPFQERCWLAACLWLEGTCGVSWRMSALAGVAPERSPLAAAARAHLSSGGVLACVLAPRLWHGCRARSLAQEVSRRGPAEGFGLDCEEEPTSEEVRAELKRLYLQLEVMRSTSLRCNNPHISKRRGGRKNPHRRFSLQALQARRGGKNKSSTAEASDVGDVSRTPEDSICSAEGPSHYTEGETQA